VNIYDQFTYSKNQSTALRVINRRAILSRSTGVAGYYRTNAVQGPNAPLTVANRFDVLATKA
jgi:hypothetical protein